VDMAVTRTIVGARAPSPMMGNLRDTRESRSSPAGNHRERRVTQGPLRVPGECCFAAQPPRRILISIRAKKAPLSARNARESLWNFFVTSQRDRHSLYVFYIVCPT
jgi:hypothetical protein